MMSNWNFSYALFNDTENSIVQPYTSFSSWNSAPIGTSDNGNGIVYFTCNGGSKAYCFTVGLDVYLFFDNWSGYTVYFYPGNNSYSGQITTASTVSLYDGTYYMAHTTLGTYRYGTFVGYNNYSSYDEGISKLNYYIQNGYDEGYAVQKYPFSLQNGYLFVYDLGSSSSSYSFDLSSKSEEYSNIGSNPFPDTNQSYWFSDVLPEIDETIIPASGATVINWSKGNNTNIFGQTQNMVASISGTSAGRYLYIYNPPVHYKWSGNSNPTASEVVNYPMVINGVSENENWYIYDSVARLIDFNQGGSVSGTVTGEQVIGSVSSDGGITLVTTSGAVYTQNSGGSTDISGANGGSIAENINGLKQTLDNFVNQFIQLLSAPISHIQQLIQSGNSFFEVFLGLFDWLPSEVSAVIISGLIIMVVVGVLKMFL